MIIDNFKEIVVKGMKDDGRCEVIDFTKDEDEAEKLVKEYSEDFGPSWVIWYE